MCSNVLLASVNKRGEMLHKVANNNNTNNLGNNINNNLNILNINSRSSPIKDNNDSDIIQQRLSLLRR